MVWTWSAVPLLAKFLAREAVTCAAGAAPRYFPHGWGPCAHCCEWLLLGALAVAAVWMRTATRSSPAPAWTAAALELLTLLGGGWRDGACGVGGSCRAYPSELLCRVLHEVAAPHTSHLPTLPPKSTPRGRLRRPLAKTLCQRPRDPGPSTQGPPKPRRRPYRWIPPKGCVMGAASFHVLTVSCNQAPLAGADNLQHPCSPQPFSRGLLQPLALALPTLTWLKFAGSAAIATQRLTAAALFAQPSARYPWSKGEPYHQQLPVPHLPPGWRGRHAAGPLSTARGPRDSCSRSRSRSPLTPKGKGCKGGGEAKDRRGPHRASDADLAKVASAAAAATVAASTVARRERRQDVRSATMPGSSRSWASSRKIIGQPRPYSWICRIA